MGRRRRVRDMQRRLAELDEWDRRYGLGGAPPGHPLGREATPWRYHSPTGEAPVSVSLRRPVAPVVRRRRRRVWPRLLVVAGLVGAAVLAVEHPEEARSAGERVIAAGQGLVQAGSDVLGTSVESGAVPVDDGPDGGRAESREPAGLADRVVDRVVDSLAVPAPGGWRPASGSRVLPPVQVRDGGSHAFVALQPGSDVPVGFSPCEVVEVEVNPDRAPAGYRDLVAGSLDRLTEASGLQLELVGETTDSWDDRSREPGAPVLVSWATADEVPELSGIVAGLGGPMTVSGPEGVWAAGGRVVMEADLDIAQEHHAALLDHEMAHVLGLDHVDDPGELMAPTNVGLTTFGPGDLEGLARLGAIPCA